MSLPLVDRWNDAECADCGAVVAYDDACDLYDDETRVLCEPCTEAALAEAF